MDYCDECRRFLNGALVCPGCGAYAPDIAPPGMRVSSLTPGLAGEAEEAERVERVKRVERVEDIDEAVEPAAEPAAIPPSNPRPATARWRLNRRGAVAATAVALVGGGLTVAAIPLSHSGGHPAATSPDASDPAATPRATPSAPPDTTGAPASPSSPTWAAVPGGVLSSRTVAAAPRGGPTALPSGTSRVVPTSVTHPGTLTTTAPPTTATGGPPSTTAAPTPPSSSAPGRPTPRPCVLLICLP